MNLMFKERIVQVDIKTASKSDISRNPFDRICHVQISSSLQRLWDILSEINMNDLIVIVFNNNILVCVKDMLANITILIRM